MHPVLESLLTEAPVVLDGASGTQFQRHGLASGACAESWNILKPDVVATICRGYVDAGSRVILTNTFGANRIALAGHGWSHFTALINRAGASIARRAAGDAAWVFGSMGPSGKMLMMGDVTEDALYNAFLEQARALAAGGAHGLVVETMADTAEAACAIRAARETGLPVVACMAFDAGAEKDRTMMGVTAPDAARALAEAGADVVGANCGVGMHEAIAVCRAMHEATDLPLWIKPNAGLPEVRDGETVYDTDAAGFAARAGELVEAGATFVGGCCGTSPAFVAALRAALHGEDAAEGPGPADDAMMPEDLDALGSRFKMLCCEVFYREMCAAIARSPHQIDATFVPKGLHDIGSVNMVGELQKLVDAVDADAYDAILLGYGLCNNGIAGITARDIPIVAPRAHDCITMFLGGHARYMDEFNANPGTYYKTSGWIERGDAGADLMQLTVRNRIGMNQTYEEMVEKYGEDNAQYIMEQLGRETANYNTYTFIEMGVEPDDRFERHTRALAKKRGWQFNKLQGDRGMIERLARGEWNDREFLILRPGQKIAPRFDDTIIDAVDA